jgi:hypothetical protein
VSPARRMRGWLHDHPGTRAVLVVTACLAVWILLGTIGVHVIYGGR